MKLIFALGNPELRYDGTRHNTGFLLIDAFTSNKGTTWQQKDKFKAHIAEFTEGGEKVIIAKPTTYYNLVGESARAVADFYKITPENILVIHDDIALPFGTVRTRIGGSDAGNNGLKSLATHIGIDTARIRVGIWNDLRDRIDDADFVLSRFTADERAELQKLQPKITELIDDFIAGRLKATTHR